MDPQDFGFLDPDSQKYVDPRIRIQGVKYQKKSVLLQNPKSELMKKKIIKISSFLNGSSSFRIKISEKNKTKNLKIFLLNKFSKPYRNDLDRDRDPDLDPDPFFPERIRIRIKIEWILSTDDKVHKKFIKTITTFIN